MRPASTSWVRTDPDKNPRLRLAVKEAKSKLVGKRKEIKRAEQIVRNLEREYQLLLLEITDNA